MLGDQIARDEIHLGIHLATDNLAHVVEHDAEVFASGRPAPVRVVDRGGDRALSLARTCTVPSASRQMK